MAAIGLPTDPTLAALAGAGVVGGLILLVRGLQGFRAAGRMGGTSTSRISGLAVGEVLVSGAAEAVEVTLVSPLQSAPCLYYRARVHESGDGDGRNLLAEERAVGFRVRDSSGAVRVFPRGARFDVPNRFDASSGSWDADPPGLLPRTGSAFGPAPDRESQIDALLTVRDPGRDPWAPHSPPGGAMALGSNIGLLGAATSRRHFQEARIEPGDVVTVMGRVLPFGELDDPRAADKVDGASDPVADPEIAADLAEARAAGLLADDPEQAWGNAAIEGFGIGRPVRPPILDPSATPPPAPDPTVAAQAAAAFYIDPQDLVIAASSEVPLVISIGPPAEFAARQRGLFVVGLLGAILSIGSAMVLALVIDGTIR
jgi:hypothetical protein